MKRLVLVLALGLVACGDDAKKSSSSPNNTSSNNTSSNNTSSNNTSSNNTSNINVADELWDMLCEATFDCPSPDLLAFMGRYPNVSACKAADPPSFLDFPGFDEAVARGTVTFNDAKAQTCLNAWRESFCELSFVAPPAECDEVAVGKLEAGESCVDSVECAPGLDCSYTGDNACTGICEPNCNEFSCTNDEYCSESGCVEKGSSGASCNDFDECARGLFCIEGTCGAGNVTAEGGDCQVTGECQGDLQCVGGMCSAVELGTRGSSCSIGEVSKLCVAGSVCTDLSLGNNELVGTCGSPKSEGGACRVFYECEIGLTCDSESPLVEGKCIPVRPNGEPCSTIFDCESGSCEGDVCVAPTTCE